MKFSIKALVAGGAALGTALAMSTTVAAKPNAKSQRIIDHWTQDRIEAAVPRDMVIDHRGLGYIRGKNGALTPHGHGVKSTLRSVKTAKPVPHMGPGNSGGDTTPPTISSLDPADGASIGTTQVFSANVTDDSGVKSVTFNVIYQGQTYNFAGTHTGGGNYETSVQGFTAGTAGSWNVTATDTAKKGGNSSTSATNSFSVGGGGTGSGDDVANTRWTNGGDIQTSVGRLFYEMPSNSRRKRWSGFVCSGTVATDSTTGRSVIITASHCVYDDANKAFARNVLFIPDQDGTSGTGTDSNCSNDPIGCWTANFGVVDVNWTTRTFPDNIPWDYAYYVVNDSGQHSGAASSSDSLETAVGGFNVNFSAPAVDDGTDGKFTQDYTHGMGYSYSDDPNFMYCAEDMSTEGTDNWWLAQCGLSGGSSGGPWIQPMDENTGTGPIISVNSWGYNGSPGMAGPKLNGTSASCVFNAAIGTSFASVPTTDGDEGVIATCP